MVLKFAVVFEETPRNYAAYVPDLPGCISTGEAWSDITSMIQDSIAFHIEAMLDDGEPLPQPRMSLEEAMTYHRRALTDLDVIPSDLGDFAPTLSTTFEMVEVDV